MRNRPSVMRRIRPPLLSSRVRKISPAIPRSRAMKPSELDDRRDALAFPLAGEGGGEGDPPEDGRVPSSDGDRSSGRWFSFWRPMVAAARNRGKGFFAPEEKLVASDVSDRQPCSILA